METSQKFKKFRNNTLLKSIIIPIITIILSALIFYMTIPYIEEALPNGEEYSEQTVQTEAIENE